MKKKVFLYIPIYMGIFLILSFIEIFLLKPFIDFFGNNFWRNFIVYTLIMLLINPILCKILGDLIKIDFDEDDSKGDLL